MEIITTLATIPAILALVNLAKHFGVVGRWSTLLAVALGVLLALADWAAIGPPGGSWYTAAASGLILGLSASGLYDVSVTVGNPRTQPAVHVWPSISQTAEPTGRVDNVPPDPADDPVDVVEEFAPIDDAESEVV